MAAAPTFIVSTAPAQPVVDLTTAPGSALSNQAFDRSYQPKLKGLAIAEVVLGIISFIIGAATSGIVGDGPIPYQSYGYNYYGDNYRYYGTRYAYAFTTGEGIWCGVWIIVAGGLGIGGAKPSASRCLISTHMAFSIVGSVFSGVMFSIAVVGAILGSAVEQFTGKAHLVSLYGILCVVSFSSMVLLIVSACYSCAALKCCGSCCLGYGQSNAGGNVVYTQTTVGGQAFAYPQQSVIGGQQVVLAQQPAVLGQPAQPVMVAQGVPGISQGYAGPGSAIIQPGPQGVFQSNQLADKPMENHPPSYQA